MQIYSILSILFNLFIGLIFLTLIPDLLFISYYKTKGYDISSKKQDIMAMN